MGLEPLMVDAQTEPALVLLSVDPVAPVQFQRLEPGDSPNSTNFTDHLEIEFNPDRPLVYVILQNTGWSEGAIGLMSSMLSPDESYVALEVLPDGNRYTLREGGLAFELDYQENLGDSGESGFRMHMLISQMQTFAIYQIADSEGVVFRGYSNTRTSTTVVPSPVEYRVDPAPVFDRIVLDCHIVAFIVPPSATPSTDEAENPSPPLQNPYRAGRAYNDTGTHCQVIEIATNRVVLTTWAQYTTYNTVKACGFSSDWKKFAAAYHYGHEGNYTWIGVWSTETGGFLYSKRESGWIYSVAGAF
jgi:hypothetical protein